MQARTPIEQAAIQHFLGLPGIQQNIDAEFITGADQSQALCLIIDDQNDAQTIVDHLFNQNMGSTTNRGNKKKNVQHYNNSHQFAVYIRDDQLRAYDQQLNLNIYNAVANQAPAQPQTPAVPLAPNVFFHQTGPVFPAPSVRAQHVVRITQHTRKDLNLKHQVVNGQQVEGHEIAEEKTLTQLMATIPGHLTGLAKDDYIIQNFLGQWCLTDDRQSLRFLLLKDLFDKPECVDTMASLHAKSDFLFANERAIAKAISRGINPQDINNQETNYFFNMLQTKNPSGWRPKDSIRGQSRWHKYDPSTNSTYVRTPHNRGREDAQPGRMTATYTATSLLPTQPQYMRMFQNSHMVVIISDLNKSYLHKYKYLFNKNAVTKHMWWYGVRGMNKPHNREYGRSLTFIRQKNANAVRNQIQRDWTEFLTSFRQYGIDVLGARNDSPVDRLNALSSMYNTKFEYELDYDLPITIMPTGVNKKHYTRDQQLADIIYAYDQTNSHDQMWNICNHMVTQGVVQYRTNGHTNPHHFTYYLHSASKHFVIKQFILAQRRFLTTQQIDLLKQTFAHEQDIIPLLHFTDQDSLILANTLPTTDAEWQKAIEQIEKLSSEVKLNANELQTVIDNLDALMGYCFKQTDKPTLLHDTIDQVLSYVQDQDVYQVIVNFFGKNQQPLPINQQHADILLQKAYQVVLEKDAAIFWASFVEDFNNLGYCSTNFSDGNTLLHHLIISGQADRVIHNIENRNWLIDAENDNDETVFDVIKPTDGHITALLLMHASKVKKGLTLTCERFEHIVECLATSTHNQNYKKALKYLTKHTTVSGGQFTDAIYNHLNLLHAKEPAHTDTLLIKLLDELPVPPDTNTLFSSDLMLTTLQTCIQEKHLAKIKEIIHHFGFQPCNASHELVHNAAILQFPEYSTNVIYLAQYWPQDLVTADSNGKTPINYLLDGNNVATIIELVKNQHTLTEGNLIDVIKHCQDLDAYDELIELIMLLDLTQLTQVAAHITQSDVVHAIVASNDNPFLLRHLSQHGVSLTDTDQNGKTPLDVAIEFQRTTNAATIIELTSAGQFNRADSLLYNVVTQLPENQVRRYALKLTESQTIHEASSQQDSPLLWLINKKQYDLANYLIECAHNNKFDDAKNPAGLTVMDVIPADCSEVWQQVFTNFDAQANANASMIVDVESYERIVTALLAHSANLDQQLDHFLAVAIPNGGQFSAQFYDSLNETLIKSSQNAIELTKTVLKQLDNNTNEAFQQDGLFVQVTHNLIAEQNEQLLDKWLNLHPTLATSQDSHQLVHAICKHEIFDNVLAFADLWPNDLTLSDDDHKTPIHYLLDGYQLDLVAQIVEKHPTLINEYALNAIVNYCVQNPPDRIDTFASILTQVDFKNMASVQQNIIDNHLLHRMVEHQVDPAVFAKVIAQGIKLDSTNPDGINLIELACQNERTEHMRALFKQHLTLANNNNNDSVLYLAVLFGEQQYIEQLIEKGFLCHEKSTDATISPLLYVIQKGKTDLTLSMVQRALTHYQKDDFENGVIPALLPHIHNIFNKQQTVNLYQQLCAKGYHDSAQQLLSKTGAIFDTEVTDSNQNTRLHIGAMYGLPKKAIELLISQGCLPTFVNANGKTAFDLAIERKQWDVVETLLDHLTQAYDASKLAANILTLFADKQYDIVAKIFNQNELTIDYRAADSNKDNMLHHAILSYIPDLRRFILGKEPNLLNEINNQGETALTFVINQDDIDQVKELVPHLSATHPTYSATRCFIYLIEKKDFDTANLLLNSKVVIDPIEAEKHISHLVEDNQPKLIEKLREHTNLQLTGNSLFALQSAFAGFKLDCVTQLLKGYEGNHTILKPYNTSSEFQKSVKSFIEYYKFKDLLDKAIVNNNQSTLRFLLQYSHHANSTDVLKSTITTLITEIENPATVDKGKPIKQLKMILKHAKDIPDQKQLLFKAGRAIAKETTQGDAKTNVSFFSHMQTSSLAKKRMASAAYVTEKLHTLDNEKDILDLVNNLEIDQNKPNNNFLLKPLRIILGWLAHIWKSPNIPSVVKTSSTWSNIMKMAKLRLIHVAVEQQKVDINFELSDKAQDFLNTNRRGWTVKETSSMHIYNGFFKPTAKWDAAKADKALHKQDQKVDRWVKRKLGGTSGAPAA